MNEETVTQSYYIATEAAPADDRTRVLKHGMMFAVFDRYGDIETRGLKEQGIFFEGTRFLSQFELYLGRFRPLLLSSTVKSDNSMFTADLANLDIAHDSQLLIPRGTVHLKRTQFLWQGTCYEQFHLINYGLSPVTIPLRIRFGADYADIFEVRGVTRTRRGRRLPDFVGNDCVVLSYEGLDGVVRQTRLHCIPPPRSISSSEIRYDPFLEPRAQSTFTVVLSCQSSTDRQPYSYEQAWDSAVIEVNEAHQEHCRVTSSNDELSQWLERSHADVQMMIVGNPERNYPYAGVPWFSTVFGRDGIITALQCLWLNPAIARGVLEFLAKTQATELNPASDAEPGKIIHEMRQGEMSALGEVPFGRYYGTIDATPLFVMLADAYYTRTADRDTIAQLWPNVERALGWIANYGDRDGDGFVEYARYSDKGLVQQGWKDSNDSVFHADGTLAEGPIALCEVQGYVYAAKYGAARLCKALGDDQRAAALEADALRLRDRFHKAFWMDDLSTYALALDGKKQPCRVRTSNPGHCLYTGIAQPEAGRRTARTLMDRDSFSGWGVRTVAKTEARYNPISYHNGSVWPHDNALIAAGFSRYGMKELAAEVFSALFSASSFSDLRRLPELFCGLDRRTGEGPTAYPVACAPQAWAAASTFMLLEACLGISFDAANHRIRFDDPFLPESVPQLTIRNLRVGEGYVDLLAERHGNSLEIQTLDKRGEVDIVVA